MSVLHPYHSRETRIIIPAILRLNIGFPTQLIGILLLLCFHSVYAQQPIALFTEYFEEPTSSTTGLSQESVAWSATCDDCVESNDYFMVVGNSLVNNGSNGPAKFETENIPITGCGMIGLDIVYNFNQPWEGDGNMDTWDECAPGQCSPPYVDPLSYCDNCWDFLYIQVLGDGAVIEDYLIGEPGTTDAEQGGNITLSFPYNNISNVAIRIYSQVHGETKRANITYVHLDHTIGTPPVADIQATIDGNVVPINNNSLTLCHTQSLVLSSIGGYAASWDVPYLSSPTNNPVSVPSTSSSSGTYTLNVENDGCIDSQSIDITILEDSPDAGSDGTLAACENQLLTEEMLFAELGGSPNAGGSWTPSIPTYATTNQTFTYTVNSCANTTDTSQVVMTVIPEPNRAYIENVGAVLDDTYEICKNPITGDGDGLSLPLAELQNLLSQFDIILTSPSGVIIDLTNEYTTIPEQLTLIAELQSFVEEGNWVVQVIHENDDPTLPYNNTNCSWTGSLYLNVLEDPYAGEDGTLTICSSDSLNTTDLFDSLEANADGDRAETGGTWSTSSAGVSINNATGEISLPSTGTTFSFTYTVQAEGQLQTNLQSGTFCPEPEDTAIVTVSIITEANAGSIMAPTSICTTDNTATASSNGDEDGVWSSSDENVFTINPNSGSITPVSAGEADIIYTVSGEGGCEDDFVTLPIEIIAMQDLVLPQTYLIEYCYEQDINFPEITNNEGDIVEGTWTPDTIDNTSSSDYSFTANQGCYNTLDLDITIHPLPVTNPIIYQP